MINFGTLHKLSELIFTAVKLQKLLFKKLKRVFH